MQAKHPIHIKQNENKEFKKSLGYIARACLKTNKPMESHAVSLFTWQYTEVSGSKSVHTVVHFQCSL